MSVQLETEIDEEQAEILREKLIKGMIERFQCPGCVHGSDTNCPLFTLEERGDGRRCSAHVLGTSIGLQNKFALGMPKGFNKPRIKPDRAALESTMRIWFYPKGSDPDVFDWLNVPVWVLEDDGFLFIRLYSPRIDDSCVLVLEGAEASDLPQAIDVSGRLGEID